jgi:hypothetical protein
LARPSLDGIIGRGERLRAWASDPRCGTFVGTRFFHREETREIAVGSVILAGNRQLSDPELLSAEGARHYVVVIRGVALSAASLPYAQDGFAAS